MFNNYRLQKKSALYLLIADLRQCCSVLCYYSYPSVTCKLPVTIRCPFSHVLFLPLDHHQVNTSTKDLHANRILVETSNHTAASVNRRAAFLNP